MRDSLIAELSKMVVTKHMQVQEVKFCLIFMNLKFSSSVTQATFPLFNVHTRLPHWSAYAGNMSIMAASAAGQCWLMEMCAPCPLAFYPAFTWAGALDSALICLLHVPHLPATRTFYLCSCLWVSWQTPTWVGSVGPARLSCFFIVSGRSCQ